jgi:transcription factor E
MVASNKTHRSNKAKRTAYKPNSNGHASRPKDKKANNRIDARKVTKKNTETNTHAQDKADAVSGAEAARKITLGLPGASEAKGAIDILLNNNIGITYLKKNVSRSVADVISLLTVARTDEYIAEKLGIKINAVRRILNIMQNYGITNYYISKNKNGWLSFAWYMNTSKLPAFLEHVRGVESEKSMIEENCNDYFICNSCYKDNKLIFTFDAAYEAGFSCNACGKNLDRLGGKNDVERLLDESTHEIEDPRPSGITNVRPGTK